MEVFVRYKHREINVVFYIFFAGAGSVFRPVSFSPVASCEFQVDKLQVCGCYCNECYSSACYDSLSW